MMTLLLILISGFTRERFFEKDKVMEICAKSTQSLFGFRGRVSA